RQEDAIFRRVVAGGVDGVDAPGAGLLFRVALADVAREDAQGLAAEQARVLHPAPDVVELLLQFLFVGRAEVVADRRARHVEAEAGAAALEAREVFRRGLGEIVRGRLDRVEAELGGEIDEVVERHLGLRLRLEIEILAVAVRGDAQAHLGLAVAPDRFNGRGDAGGERDSGSGEELAARKQHGVAPWDRGRPQVSSRGAAMSSADAGRKCGRNHRSRTGSGSIREAPEEGASMSKEPSARVARRMRVSSEGPDSTGGGGGIAPDNWM